jgi:hypothetical protein
MENGAIFYKVEVRQRERTTADKLPVIGFIATALLNLTEKNWQIYDIYPENPVDKSEARQIAYRQRKYHKKGWLEEKVSVVKY